MARFVLFEKTREMEQKTERHDTCAREAEGCEEPTTSPESSSCAGAPPRRSGPHTSDRRWLLRPPAPPVLLLSHGEEFEARVGLASEAAARFDLYVELLCLEAVDRAVVEYFDVSVGWVQQQQQQLEQHEQFEQ